MELVRRQRRRGRRVIAVFFRKKLFRMKQQEDVQLMKHMSKDDIDKDFNSPCNVRTMPTNTI